MVRMNNRKVGLNSDKKTINIILGFLLIIILLKIASGVTEKVSEMITSYTNSNEINILSSYENSYMEDEVEKYAEKEGIDVNFEYMGDLDMVDELNRNSESYDAVWISNSMWLYMLENPYLYSDSKSISISPVVFGIKENKAKELGLTDKNVTNTDIMNLIKENKIKYVMNSVTQTNTGATAYLGFLTSLAGNPEVLTESMIHNESLINNLKDVFKGVSRVSGDESYLEEMFLKKDNYEAIIASEASLININKKLQSKNKEQLHLIYPTDGVAINDSAFAFIDNKENKEDNFLKIQNYLLSKNGQKLLENNGQRTWYGGTTTNANKKVFNKDWGIDTNKYLNVTRFPSKKVMTEALNLYIEEMRKPTHVVFCLDYSGSMYGSGYEDLTSAMEYILNREEAAKDKLQFSKKDKITVITFGNNIKNVWTTTGDNTSDLIQKIKDEKVEGGTALYAAIEKGLAELENESDDYTKTIIAMTDGEINIGKFEDLRDLYKSGSSKISEIPIYSITFGNANEAQLTHIATLSNAKVFDGTYDLLDAFKEVRSYN